MNGTTATHTESALNLNVARMHHRSFWLDQTEPESEARDLPIGVSRARPAAWALGDGRGRSRPRSPRW
jgi:hypothetical protein